MALTFAQIGSIYNAMTDELIGGVSPANKALVLDQIKMVQNGVQTLINNGAFDNFTNADTGNVTKVHAQNIADQMNHLTKLVGTTFGTDVNTPPKYINDVVRDVQDIVAGDNNLAAMAAPTKGFMQVSNLLNPPTPYPDTPAQQQTLLKFIADSNDLAARATAAVGMDPNSATVKQLITDITTVETNINQYSQAQGGIFSARFNNEFNAVVQDKSGGVFGTAANELIKGLQTGDAQLIKGAATVITQNAMDVRGNMFVTGDVAKTPVLPTVQDIHTGGQYFDDAVTKLIGGLYGPSTTPAGATIPGNQASVVTDLKNAALGIQDSLGGLTGASLAHAKVAIGLINKEVADVAGITVTPTQPISPMNTKIALETAGVLNIINHDANLTKLAGGTFIPLPPVPPGTPMGPGVPHSGTDMVAAADMMQQHTVTDFAHMWHHA